MILIDKLNRYRLIFIIIILGMLFVWFAVPIAIAVRGFISNDPILSPIEITKIVRKLYIFLLPLILSMFLYGVWFSCTTRKLFWGLVVEKFLFHMCIYTLFAGSMAIYRSNFTRNGFQLSWEFIGFSAACVFILFQYSFQSVKKELQKRNLKK